jgi:hypothetical protein
MESGYMVNRDVATVISRDVLTIQGFTSGHQAPHGRHDLQVLDSLTSLFEI